MIQGLWGTYAMEPCTRSLPLTPCSSPRIAASRELLPAYSFYIKYESFVVTLSHAHARVCLQSPQPQQNTCPVRPLVHKLFGRKKSKDGSKRMPLDLHKNNSLSS